MRIRLPGAAAKIAAATNERERLRIYEQLIEDSAQDAIDGLRQVLASRVDFGADAPSSKDNHALVAGYIDQHPGCVLSDIARDLRIFGRDVSAALKAIDDRGYRQVADGRLFGPVIRDRWPWGQAAAAEKSA
jgi:hypothetical protein